jgi:hypothetical protein
MNENTIIKPEDIRKVRPIAENLRDEKRIAPYIRETEQLDIMPAIGVSLYKQISEENFIETLTTHSNIPIVTNNGKVIILKESDWNKFVDGDYFTCDDCSCINDKIRYSAGLRATVAYLAYARMLPNQPLNVTAFGVVQKTTNLSEPVDEKTLFRASGEARKIGLEYLRQSVDYLKCLGLIGDCTNTVTRRYRKFIAIG